VTAEAALDELPDVLRAPPWDAPRPARPQRPDALEIEPPPADTRIHLDAEVVDAWRMNVPEWARRVVVIDSVVVSKVEQARSKFDAHPRAPTIPAYELFSLRDDTLARIFSGYPHAMFDWDAHDCERVLHHTVARLGPRAVPGLVQHFEVRPKATLEVSAWVEASELALPVARALQSSRLRWRAALWLLRFDRTAAAGLIQHALGAGSEARQASEHALQFLAGCGRRKVIERVASECSPSAVDALAESRAMNPFLRLPRRPPPQPAFVRIDRLPRPRLVTGALLPATAAETLLRMLALSDVLDPCPGLEDVRRACDRGSLADFASALAKAWIAAGAPPKQRFAMLAVGLLGDQHGVDELGQYAAKWPSEGHAARAAHALDALAAHGSNAALAGLDRIRTRGSPSVRARATEALEAIAAWRGLAREELSDLIVPEDDAEVRGHFIRRFEQLLVSGRSIGLDHLRDAFLSNPTAAEMAASLVWRAADRDGAPLLLRPTGEIVGLDDRSCASEPQRVQVAHPAEMPDSTLQEARRHLPSQAIAQLDREVFRPRKDEERVCWLDQTRFDEWRTSGRAIAALLRRGYRPLWQEGISEKLEGAVLVLPGDRYQVAVYIDPPMYVIEPGDRPLRLDLSERHRFSVRLERAWVHDESEGWGALAPRLFSEVIRDLRGLAEP